MKVSAAEGRRAPAHSPAGEATASGATAEDSPGRLSPPELLRYARHLVLPEVGLAGQRKLKSARVLVVGAGGLGSPVALYLAAAGVGTLGLVDFDHVDATNLQRQILHGESDVGRPKLDSARDRLNETNPHVEVIAHQTKLNSGNALSVMAGYDVIVDGTDNFPTRYLVNDACVMLAKPNVYGSVHRWEGQVSVFATEGGPCYRCLFREPPPPGLVPNCAEGGVLGVVPGVVGSLQALETVKLILGQGSPLAGRLLIFDGLELEWREISIRRDPACPVCGDSPTQTALIDYELFCGVKPEADLMTLPANDEALEPSGPGSIDVLEASARLGSAAPPFLLDVRETYEWEISNLAQHGAVLIPMGEVGARLDDVPRDREIIVHCRTGVRSGDVANQLWRAGYRQVLNLEGGINAWAREVDPGLQIY